MSEKESRVALRLSSTSGCQAAGMLSARGWPRGDGEFRLSQRHWDHREGWKTRCRSKSGVVPAKGQGA